jgi:hypothetical protein
VTVRCREADGTTWRSEAGEDGRFRFGAMPAIGVELSVDNAPPGSPGALRVNTGRRDVVLTVAKFAAPDQK